MSTQTQWMFGTDDVVPDDLRRKGNLLVAGQFTCLGLTLLPLGPALALPGGQALGLLLALAGLAVGGTALRNMGRQTRIHPVPRARLRLRTTGIYARVRHPMYLAVLLIGAGATLAGGRLLALAGLLGLILVLRAKMAFEEQLLEEEFGWEYSVYAIRVPALLPRVHS